MITLGSFAALLALSLFAAAMIHAAVRDVLTMTVSDAVVIGLVAGFVVLAPLAHWSASDIALSFAAATAVLLVSVGFFAFGWIGGGDGKLAAVAALWLGAANTVVFATWMAVLGGLCGVALLVFRAVPLPEAWLRNASVARLRDARTGIPYAVAIALAALVVLPASPWSDCFTAADTTLRPMSESDLSRITQNPKDF